MLRFEQAMQHFGRSRAIFIPSISDASPRVITQALSLNVPCIVNYNIIGGWKYVNPQTGVYFTNSTDVVDAYRKLMELEKSGELRPREWYEKYAVMASKKLQSFVEMLKKDYVYDTEFIHPDDYPLPYDEEEEELEEG